MTQQQSRRRLPSLHAIGRSRCVDLEDTPTEQAWLPPLNHDVDKQDDEDDQNVTPPARYTRTHSVDVREKFVITKNKTKT